MGKLHNKSINSRINRQGVIIADVHRAQQTKTVKTLLARTKTALVNIPGGLASYLQVVAVIVNKPFKDHVRLMSEKHIEENLDLYTEGKITASQRRVLITQWCGEAWSLVDRDSVVRGFKTLGVTTTLDGSENHLVNIPKLPDYEMPTEFLEEEYAIIDSDDESDYEFGSSDNDIDTDGEDTSDDE